MEFAERVLAVACNGFVQRLQRRLALLERVLGLYKKPRTLTNQTFPFFRFFLNSKCLITWLKVNIDFLLSWLCPASVLPTRASWAHAGPAVQRPKSVINRFPFLFHLCFILIFFKRLQRRFVLFIFVQRLQRRLALLECMLGLLWKRSRSKSLNVNISRSNDSGQT